MPDDEREAFQIGSPAKRLAGAYKAFAIKDIVATLHEETQARRHHRSAVSMESTLG